MAPGPASSASRAIPRGLLAAAVLVALAATGTAPARAAEPVVIPPGGQAVVPFGESNVLNPGSDMCTSTPGTSVKVVPSTALTVLTPLAGLTVQTGTALTVRVSPSVSPGVIIGISWATSGGNCFSANGIAYVRVGAKVPPASLNKCLQANGWGQGPTDRRQYHGWEIDVRDAAARLKQAAEVLDIFWYLEQIEKSGLTKNIGDALDKAEKSLDVAEKATWAADARVRTTQAQLKAERNPAKRRRLALELKERKQTQSLAHKTLDQLQRSRVGDLVTKLRRSGQLKNLQNALKQLDAAQKRLREFFKKYPSAKATGRFLSVVGIASQEATYSAWAAEMIANLYRELRRPPPGCTEHFEQLPTSVEGSASALASATAKPAFEPLVAPVADLPPAITGGRLPAVATKFRRQLAELTAYIPAVHAALLKQGQSKAARAALKRTLPRLRGLLASVGSLRPKLAGALRIKPRTISQADLSKYRPQAPSRAALRLLGNGDAPRSLRNDFKQLYRDGSKPTGLQDPLATLADPALAQLERNAAKALASLE